MAFIEIRQLGKVFGNFQALKDVDLDIAEKEFITFLGPSGCGKTTMLRTLAGFLTPRLQERSPRSAAAWAWCFRTTPCGRT